MKKKVLFVIDSLDVAGAEKSLITLLNLLDLSRYSVDLQLFAYGRPFENLLPSEVHLLKPLEYTKYTEMGLIKLILHSFVKPKFKILLSRMKYSINIRKKDYDNAQKAMLFWKNTSSVIEVNPKEYDIAISYAEGVPTLYVADKVKAKKKFAWMNNSYRLEPNEKKYYKRFYDQYNKIIAVSDSAKEILMETFPYYDDKTNIIYDINNPGLISSMANKGSYNEEHFGGIKLLTIGRLSHQKGYDVALEACRILKEKDIHFKWYVLGKGPLKKWMEDFIKDHHLSRQFILLGVKSNPYPYIKNTDIYVQTSRSEGFCLAIAEARMLNIPVVTTRFDAVYNQMVNEKNGLVVDMNAEAVRDGILRLINDQELKQHIVGYLQTEKKGNVEEINKIYDLLG